MAMAFQVLGISPFSSVKNAGQLVMDVLKRGQTPKDIITLLNREIAAVVTPPEVQERLATLGFETDNVTPEELAAFLKAEIPRWAAVIQAARIKVE